MNWLATVLAKMVREALDWGQKNAETPTKTTDAKTPDSVRRGWRDYLDKRLRDQKRDGN